MSPSGKKNVLGLVSVGLFLALVGVILVITPEWYNAARNFFEDFELKQVDGNVYLPEPANPRDHKMVYTAVWQFCLGWGIIQMGILVTRFFLRDTVQKKADTLSGTVFWMGTGYTTSLLLNESIDWFAFWAWVMIFIGLTLVVRSLVVLLYEHMR